MKTNINIELFKRYAPKKKGDIISSLTPSELFAITEDTIKRIIKEVGNRRYRSREKELQFSSEYKISSRVVSFMLPQSIFSEIKKNSFSG